MATADEIQVEIVVAMPDRQVLRSLRLPVGTDALGAVTKADLQSRFPDLDLKACRLAVWGRPVAGSHVLAEGDRVEVLRPLQLDPRDARRELAREGQFMGTSKQDDD